MNTEQFPEDLIGVALVVLMLGIRHGFDPDHLAAIGQCSPKWLGCFFR